MCNFVHIFIDTTIIKHIHITGLIKFKSGGKADHSPLSSAQVKNAWSYTSTPPCIMTWCLNKHWIHHHGVVLKHWGNFTFKVYTAL